MQRTKGYVQTFLNARRIGASVIQVYSGNPRRLIRVQDELQKSEARLADVREARKRFVGRPHATRSAKSSLAQRDQTGTGATRIRLFFHSPYLINLSNPDAAKMKLNAEVLCQELGVCEEAGGEGVVVHTGKRKADDGQTDESAYQTFVKTVQLALGKFKGHSRVLLETSAGEGNSIGVRVEDFARLYMHSGFTAAERKDRLGIVFDTCHVFGSGYDISQPGVVRSLLYTLHEIHKIPISHVKLIHLNDSKGVLGSLTDFHQNLGHGELYGGNRFEGLKELMWMYVPRGVPFVLETPAGKTATMLSKGKTRASAPCATDTPSHQDEIALCHQLWTEVCSQRTPRKHTARATSIHVPTQELVRVLTDKARKRTKRLSSSTSGSARVVARSDVTTRKCMGCEAVCG